MTTTTVTPELADGLQISAAWRFVAETDPGLAQAWQDARADYDAKEAAWRERTADYQDRRNIPRRRIPSPHGKALATAAQAVEAAIEELLVSGRIPGATPKSSRR